MKYSYWLLLITIVVFSACKHRQEKGRIVLNFNENWSFYLGDDSTASKRDYNDSSWKKIDVPHDWSVEGPFDKEAPSTTAEAALPTGIGWYRKSFSIPGA